MGTAHGQLRTDAMVLQVAVGRLLGYRWPAELDADMELADEQREWVNRSQDLLPYADKDGIVCIPGARRSIGCRSPAEPPGRRRNAQETLGTDSPRREAQDPLEEGSRQRRGIGSLVLSWPRI